MFLTYSAVGGQVPQQEEAGNGGVLGDGSLADNLDPPSAIPGVMVITSSAMSTLARNVIGMPTLYTDKVDEHHSSVSDDEDSEERKRKAMDWLRKVSTCNCLLSLCTMCSNVMCICLI